MDETAASCEWADIPCHISSLLDWIYDLVLWLPKKLAQLLFDGLKELIYAIPVPDFVSDAGNLGAIPDGVVWFIDLMAARECAAIIISAYLARFILRRIPVIG